jgi:hypothetical protein
MLIREDERAGSRSAVARLSESGKAGRATLLGVGSRLQSSCKTVLRRPVRPKELSLNLCKLDTIQPVKLV